MLTIHVKNEASFTQNFYFFQQPSEFTGGRPYSNSLFTSPLANYPQSGAMLTFQVPAQLYAFAQTGQQIQVGQPSGSATFEVTYRADGA